MHIGEKSNKCNQCDYASSQAGNLRAHLKTHSGEKSDVTLPALPQVWLCILCPNQFEDTFENAQWRKAKQMQPVWVCILSGKRFEDTFEITRWRKANVKWHIESAESFKYSNIIYSLERICRCEFKITDRVTDQETIFLPFCLCQWKTKEIVLLFCLSAIWTKTFSNLDKYILQFKKSIILCEINTWEPLSLWMGDLRNWVNTHVSPFDIFL